MTSMRRPEPLTDDRRFIVAAALLFLGSTATAAIAVERLAPARWPAATIIGTAMIALGALRWLAALAPPS
jgi:hypothetical protein